MPVPLSYEQALAYLSHLHKREWRHGLDRMAELCRRLGVEKGGQPRFFHVAGTNGKGSTTAWLHSLLRAHGHSTGAYFSPYVFDIRERWQRDRTWIGKDELAALISEVRPVADDLMLTAYGGATEFEVKTALGFLYWQRHACTHVALEVGMGGRLDSTNVIDPAVSLITSIGYDHQAILGDTLAEIARAKAGIINPGRPVVVGDVPAEADAVIAECARQAEAPLWRLGREFRVVERDGQHCDIVTPTRSFTDLQIAIPGSKQAQNLAISVAALEAAGEQLDEQAIRRGAAEARIPGRMQRVTWQGRSFLLDGAHNEEAAQALAASLGPGNRTLITGMLAGHDARPFYRALAGCFDRVICVPVQNLRSRRVAELTADVRETFAEADSYDSIDEALANLGSTDQEVVISGSFYLLSDWQRATGLPVETLVFGEG